MFSMMLSLRTPPEHHYYFKIPEVIPTRQITEDYTIKNDCSKHTWFSVENSLMMFLLTAISSQVTRFTFLVPDRVSAPTLGNRALGGVHSGVLLTVLQERILFRTSKAGFMKK